jgi:hypothetical protein
VHRRRLDGSNKQILLHFLEDIEAVCQDTLNSKPHTSDAYCFELTFIRHESEAAARLHAFGALSLDYHFLGRTASGFC